MTVTRLFERLGFLILDEFVDAELRRTLLSELEAATPRPATMYQLGSGRRVNEEVRRARWVEPRPATRSRLQGLLRTLRARVQDHFGVPVEGFEAQLYVDLPPQSETRIKSHLYLSPEAYFFSLKSIFSEPPDLLWDRIQYVQCHDRPGWNKSTSPILGWQRSLRAPPA